MYFKKTIFIVIILMLFLTNIVYSNNEDIETVDPVGIMEEIKATSSSIENTPKINSRSAIVIDRATKKILYGKNEYDVRKMASTTKIMTAIIVIENANLGETVSVSRQSASTGGSTLGIKEGDKLTVCDLLYGLLLKSGNDTAVALAEHVGGSIEGFADKMNAKALELGLENTHFITPHGLDNDNHYTNAYELALLTDYALKNKTFANIVQTKNYSVTINGYKKEISNTNELLGNLFGVYGVKTGFTNGANRCLVTACKRDDLDIICVVLGADTKKCRTQDSIQLIEYVFKAYKMVDLEQIVKASFDKWLDENICKFKINKGLSNDLNLKIKNFNYTIYPVTVKNADDVSVTIHCNYCLNAPIEQNTQIGNMTVCIGEDEVLNFEIVNTIKIDKKDCMDYFLEILSNFFKYLTIEF